VKNAARSSISASDIQLAKVLEDASLRYGSLGRLGHFLATRALEENGFRAVQEIEDKRHSYGSLVAVKGGGRFLIEVKTRRKYKKNGDLNKRYKLADSRWASGLYPSAHAAERIFRAKAHWVAVQIDKSSYSVYFGSLKQLDGRSGIAMDDPHLTDYTCLTDRKRLTDAIAAYEPEGGNDMRKPPAEIRESLRLFRHDHRDATKTAFIMMQFGKTPAHKKIVKGICGVLDDFGITAVRADGKEYSSDLFPNILTYLYGCAFGIAVFERIEAEKFNPNVALEVGYMMALGKPVCLLKDKTLEKLHTDLMGKLYREFDPQDPTPTIAATLEEWARDKRIIP
jgi:hypothetical protein